MDAAIACAFSQGVVDPQMCGVGGFGAMQLCLPERGVHTVLEFFARAPLAATPTCGRTASSASPATASSTCWTTRRTTSAAVRSARPATWRATPRRCPGSAPCRWPRSWRPPSRSPAAA
ncbi:MAG: gamma-glutamyltransferase [Janthinobacterium lividum]